MVSPFNLVIDKHGYIASAEFEWLHNNIKFWRETTGRIAEYDTPARLLEREDSFFSKLIKEYSMRSQSFNSLANVVAD